MGYPIYDSDPTSVNDPTMRLGAGDLFRFNHATYGRWILKYVQAKDAVTYAAGQVLTKANVKWTAVTNDIAGGSSIGKTFGGIALAAYTTGNWVFVLVDGYYPTVLTNGDDDIADGVQLISGTADGVCDSGTATHSFGHAIGADVDANNTVAAQICGNICGNS